MVAALRLTAVAVSAARVLSGPDRVAEGQRAGAGTAAVGRGATIVERQRRRAARHRHRLAQIERQRHRLAGIEVAARRRLHNRTDRRARGVDLRAALGQAAQRQAGGIAGTIGDGGGVEIDCGRRQSRRVLSGADRIAEGQGAGAGAADISGRAAVVERQRRRAARHRHRLAQVKRQRDSLAGIKVAARRRLYQSTLIVGAVVSICSVPAGLVTAPVRLAILPAPSVTLAEFRLTAVTVRSGVFCPAPTV